MTAITVEALEAALPKLAKVSTVFHAYHEDNDHSDVNELYADFDTATAHTAAIYAYEEYGHALIPAGALVWREVATGRWELIDQGSNTGIAVAGRPVLGVEAGAR